MRALAVVTLFAVGCGTDHYLVVTVDARTSVHNAAKLAVTATNAGTMVSDTLALAGHMFPVTLSISAPGRTGELDLAVQAVDDKGLVVGLGSGMTTVEATDAMVKLDPADFVVNTDIATDQFLTTDFETVGHQVGVTSDFSWTVSFRNTCTDSCDVFARRFDKTGAPLTTVAAVDDSNFKVTSTPTTDLAMPAIAGSKLATVAVWDFTDTTGGGTGVACRGIDATGALTPGQRTIATDMADTAMVAPMMDGNFAVAWQTTTPSVQIHTIIAKPDCTTLQAMPVVASTVTGTSSGPHRSSVASNGAAVLWVWITDDAVHVRAGTTAGTFTGSEITLYSAPPGSVVEIARVAPMGTGFAVVARVVAANFGTTTPGSLVLLRTLDTGQTITGSTPVIITDKSGSDVSTGHWGFGVATRADGTTIVVWHQCSDGSSMACDGSLDIYARTVMPDGSLPGQPFQVATTTLGNQTNPSVVALEDAFAVVWDDSSKLPPDTDGSSVRARLIYP